MARRTMYRVMRDGAGFPYAPPGVTLVETGSTVVASFDDEAHPSVWRSMRRQGFRDGSSPPAAAKQAKKAPAVPPKPTTAPPPPKRMVKPPPRASVKPPPPLATPIPSHPPVVTPESWRKSSKDDLFKLSRDEQMAILRKLGVPGRSKLKSEAARVDAIMFAREMDD